jgi:hypothetical protein
MNLIVHVGPDTIGTSRYKSKEHLRKAINLQANKRVQKKESLDLKMFGRAYSRSELQDAVILTVREHFKALMGISTG